MQGYQLRNPNGLRMFILGPRFSGKTFFVSGSPRTLILDFEDGAWGVPDNINRAGRIPIKKGEQIEAIFAQLERDKDNPSRPYDRIVFETIDQMLEITAEVLAAEYAVRYTSWGGTDIRQWGQQGAGYSILSNSIYDRLRSLESWGYTWTVCGHLKEETLNGADGKQVTVLRPVCYPSLAAVIARLADVKATVAVVKQTVPNYVETKILGTNETRRTQAGTREELRVQMDCAAEEGGMTSGAGKMRGVANLRMKIDLPPLASHKIGWDAFIESYNDAAKKVKAGIF